MTAKVDLMSTTKPVQAQYRMRVSRLSHTLPSVSSPGSEFPASVLDLMCLRDAVQTHPCESSKISSHADCQRRASTLKNCDMSGFFSVTCHAKKVYTHAKVVVRRTTTLTRKCFGGFAACAPAAPPAPPPGAPAAVRARSHFWRIRGGPPGGAAGGAAAVGLGDS